MSLLSPSSIAAHRMISLENLPDSVTEMVVKEKFPEAFNIIFYGNDESCKGYVGPLDWRQRTLFLREGVVYSRVSMFLKEP